MFFLAGRRALPVRADGGSGDVRHDLVVHPVAHAGADDGELPAAAACPSRGRPAARRAIRWSCSSAASRRGSSGSAAAIAACWRWRWAHRRSSSTGFLAFVAVSFLLAPFLGRNFFPAVDAGNILMHVAHPGRHPRRGDRQSARRHPEGDPQTHSRRDRDADRQHRHADLRHQHDLQQHRRDRSGRTATSRSS